MRHHASARLLTKASWRSRVFASEACAPLKPTTGMPLSLSRATVSPPQPPPTSTTTGQRAAPHRHHGGGDGAAVARLVAGLAHERRVPAAVARGEHGLVGAALGDVEADRGHRDAAAGVVAPARLRRLDPGGRDHLEIVVLERRGEIAVAIGAAQLLRQAGEHRGIAGAPQIRIVVEPRRNVAARARRDRLAAHEMRPAALDLDVLAVRRGGEPAQLARRRRPRMHGIEPRRPVLDDPQALRRGRRVRADDDAAALSRIDRAIPADDEAILRLRGNRCPRRNR